MSDEIQFILWCAAVSVAFWYFVLLIAQLAGAL